MKKPCLIYITCPDKKEAKQIGQILVEDRLAACVNIIDGMESIYRWQGEIVNETEAVLLVKTTDTNIESIKDRVIKTHSYTCPALLVVPIDCGLEPYLKWICDVVN